MPDLSDVFPAEFYAKPTLEVAPRLLGSWLCRRLADGSVLTAPIVEVEAYTQDDPACHAFRGPTPRCAILFGSPGLAYVYFVYGMHNCFNVVTEPEGVAGAILVRAIGVEGGDGPGKLCKTWAITREHNGVNLMDPAGELWIAKNEEIPLEHVGVSIRVGISAGQDLPWRFFVKEHPRLSVNRVKPHVRKKRASSKTIVT